jgi:hypothetical protein
MIIHDCSPLKKYLYYTIVIENSGEPISLAILLELIPPRDLVEIDQETF